MFELQVIIQAVDKSDIVLLERIFSEGGPAKHAERLARQQQGQITYLIAWYKNQPVGHGMIKWHRSHDDFVAPHLQEECPDIEDLFVLEERRSQGIGTWILRYAEDLARQRGYQQIGLSAGAEADDPARRLYERLGFRDVGFGEITERYEYIDQNGQLQVWEGLCLYLIKRIDGMRDRMDVVK